MEQIQKPNPATDPIRLKVVSDGTDAGTRVVDTVSGREVEGLVMLVFDADAGQNSPITGTITAELYGLEVRGDVAECDDLERKPAVLEVVGTPFGDGVPLSVIDLDVKGFNPPDVTGQEVEARRVRFAMPGAFISGFPAERPEQERTAFSLSLTEDPAALLKADPPEPFAGFASGPGELERWVAILEPGAVADVPDGVVDTAALFRIIETLPDAERAKWHADFFGMLRALILNLTDAYRKATENGNPAQ